MIRHSIGKLRPASTAFFLCDIQDRFRPLIWNAETVINTAKYMVDVSRVLDIPVVVTQQYTKAFGPTCPEIPLQAPEPLEGEEPGQDLPVFEKKKFSMMTEEVEQHFSSFEGLQSVVLFGQETHVCIQQTCLDLLERGLDVHIIVDGCSSQRSLDREIALKRMATSGAFLTTAESAVFMLLEGADHPSFKKISKMTVAHNQLPNEFQISNTGSSAL